MRVLVTGASGHIGSAVVPELLTAGHTVVGLARSEQAAGAVRALGAEVVRGDLDDLDMLAAAANGVDGVIHLAFRNDLNDLAGAVAADLSAIEAIGSALSGTGKPFIGTNATGAMALAGFRGLLHESDTLGGGPRVDAENDVVGFAGQGVRSCVVRLPPTVHSDGQYGFASALVAVARASGAAAYLGDGSNRWPSAGTGDVARLYRLALELAEPGTRVHAVAEEGLTLREISEAIGRRLGVPAVSIDRSESEQRFGPLSAFVVLDNPTASRTTRESLGWTPTQPGLISDLTEHPGLKPSARR